MWHQDNCSIAQEAHNLRVHPHRPESRAHREKSKGSKVNKVLTCVYSSQLQLSYYPPVKEGGEDENTEDAKGEDVEDVGQEHLPFTVETVLTFLIADGSQGWDCLEKQSEQKMYLIYQRLGEKDRTKMERK